MDQEDFNDEMEPKVGEIIYKNGLKYKKRKDCNKLRPLCIVDDCIKNAQSKYTFYCIKHFNKLGKTDEERYEIINQMKIKVQRNIENKEKEDNELLEKNSKIIDSIKIYFIDNKKFRLRETDNKMWPVCMFEGCNKYGVKEFKWCCTHAGGVDPSSSEGQKKQELLKEKRQKAGQVSNKIGEETEDWICEIMQNFTTINLVKKIGYTGHKLDIIYKMKDDGEYYGIQVKTLQINNRSKDSFNLSFEKRKYDDNTLIVCTNINRDRFVLFYAKEMAINDPTFSFGYDKAKYSRFMYKDKAVFLIQFEKLLSASCLFNSDDLTEDSQKEQLSMKRLEDKCNTINLSFEQINQKITVIDCKINNYNIQCKTTTVRDHYLYIFGLRKNAGKINGKRQFQPYNEKDNIDFFIFEMLDNPNNFYIIPIEELINNGYIKTIEREGKKDISLPALDHKKNHWAKRYLNNFDHLTG